MIPDNHACCEECYNTHDYLRCLLMYVCLRCAILHTIDIDSWMNTSKKI